MEDNVSEQSKLKSPDGAECDATAEFLSAPKLSAFGVRSSTRLLNKQKSKPEDLPSTSNADNQCKCGQTSCESCSRVLSSHHTLFIGKKRDFWSVQEQQDFFDGLKLYGKDFHSITVHMKSVAKRRARIASVSSLPSDDTVIADSAKLKTKEQLRHFYYRKLQLCQRFIGNVNANHFQSHPRDLREVYLLLCYDALKKIFRDKLDPRLARPDFAQHLSQMVISGSTVVRVGRKGRFRCKAPSCQALKSWTFSSVVGDGRCSGNGEPAEGIDVVQRPPHGDINNGNGVSLANLPTAITVEFLPANNCSWSFVQSVAHNPRVAISAPANTKLVELKALLENRWKPRNKLGEAINDHTLASEKIVVNLSLPNELKQRLLHHRLEKTSESMPESDHPEPGQAVGQDDSAAISEEVLGVEGILRLSVIELYLLVQKTTDNESSRTLRLEYTIQRVGDSNTANEQGGSMLSPALNKLLYLASIRMKLLSQSSAPTSTATRILSPLEDQGQNMDALNFDVRRAANVVTPRRRSAVRKPQFNPGMVAVNPNIVVAHPNPVSVANPVVPSQPSNAVAVNFMEQLKELRVKTQRRFNARGDYAQPAAPAHAGQQSPRILQPRRLMPKPVQVDKPGSALSIIPEGQATFTSQVMLNQRNTILIPQNPAGYSANIDSGVHGQMHPSMTSLEPSYNIVMAPYPTSSASAVAVQSQNHGQTSYTFMDCNDSSHPIQAAPTYVPPFPEASLDISLPGESTLNFELLKPSLVPPTATGELRSDRPGLGMGIGEGRPISPSANTGFDISFGDPSLGGLLGTDVTAAVSLMNKNNSLTPWLLQESSMSFFDPNGSIQFDESSFLLPATTSSGHQQQQQQQPANR